MFENAVEQARAKRGGRDSRLESRRGVRGVKTVNAYPKLGTENKYPEYNRD